MFGCRTEQLSANGNSKGHCCLSVERITAPHIRPNYSDKSEEDHDDEVKTACIVSAPRSEVGDGERSTVVCLGGRSRRAGFKKKNKNATRPTFQGKDMSCD